MKIVFIFCHHTIPQEHPNGVRMANIGLMFVELGYQVYLYGFDSVAKPEFEYKGMHCKVWEQSNRPDFASIVKRSRNQEEHVKNALMEGKPDIIISAMPNSRGQRCLIRYAKSRCIPMIESVCEWYDRSNFRGFKGLIKFINNRYSLCIQYPKRENIIAISTLLADFYRSCGCNTIVIPTMVDIEEYKAISHNRSVRTRIAYAGSPSKKDYILNAIHGLALLSEAERNNFEFHLYGPKLEQLKQLGLSNDVLEKCGNELVCHGRIPYEQVKQHIVNADFTVLLRPDKRYANAGFPTKVGESMACGTPVIANLTSDLGKYIIDGETGFVCVDESPEACKTALQRVLSMTEQEKANMRKEAMEVAKIGFNYKTYLADMRDFLSKVEGEK